MPTFRPLCGKTAGHIVAHVMSKAKTNLTSSYTVTT
jgi:hypothetical protein